MIKSLLNWLDHRTGLRVLIAAGLLEGVPGGARWRYVWGSCLAFVFSIQLITGVMLMTAYSPSSSQAWNSVHFIQYQMDFGWLIRGLHHFGSQTMMVMIALHMLQVVIAGAHLPPREVNWWLGLGLLGVTFGLSLTGYLLPWDQKGYWATDVATNIMSNIPGIGDLVKQLAVGGPDSGNHTLTRFYGLHVAILPGALILLIAAHIFIFRRHGVTSKENVEGLVTRPENEHAPGTDCFWPRQAFYDMIACMVVFGLMMSAVLYGFSHPVEVSRPDGEPAPGLYDYEYWAKAGQHGKGADLDAPADRETPNYPARPEWYFLFLFQLLKYFKADVGSFYIPNGVMVALAIMPLLGYGAMRRFGHFVGLLIMMTVLILAGMLTLLALDDDQPQGILWGILKNHNNKEGIEKAEKFQHGRHDAEILAKRACQLAMAGTPVEGGHFLIRNDPFTTGQKLFQQKCGSCHNFSKQNGDKFESWTDGKSASDLGDFGRASWVRGLLDHPMSDKYFGLIKVTELGPDDKEVKDDIGKPNIVPGLTGMRGWRKAVDKRRESKKIDAKEQDKDFDAIAEWLEYQARTPKQDRKNEKLIEDGQKAFFDDTKNKCSTCHSIEARMKDEKTNKISWEKQGDVTAPDLTDWGSAAWIRGMIMNPGHKARYGDRNLMPAFRNLDGPGAELHVEEFRDAHEKARAKIFLPLTDVERELIIRWITRDYRPVFGGTPIR